jgi:glyoxylase-like metal-dependent hydrolase (beta-lactamase superfamily II)/8-oxo-dGTP pyrophosphatase MutT (NUDIX family)
MDSATELTLPRGTRPAATVILIRDGVDGPEVLLTVRPREFSFMGGAAVFPGGALAPEDSDPRWEAASTLSRADAAAALNDSDETLALALFVGALREAYEEVGLVLGSGPLDRLPDPASGGAFLDRCLRLGVVLATDQLIPAGRWVTPPGPPDRFDTQFFIARVPDAWTPRPSAREVVQALWITPEGAVAKLAQGELVMAPPTISALQRLAGHADAATAIDSMAAGSSARAGHVVSARLHPVVHWVLAPNAGVMTGPGTNTYIVGRGPTIVIDPAVAEPAFLNAVIAAAGEVAAIVVTHRHADHTGGVRGLAERVAAPVRAFGPEPIGGRAVGPLRDGEEIVAGGVQLTALHTSGHSSDHVCLLMETSLFSGDTILGEGTAVVAPPDGDMAAYMASLRRLAGLNVRRIYPGHWRVVDHGDRLIDAYVTHRNERHEAIVKALATGAATPEDIVDVVYTDTPPSLRPVAQLTVLAHLELLEREGAVARDGAKWQPRGE